MIIDLNSKHRISNTVLNFMRKMAARNGHAINSISSDQEKLEALIKGLPADIADDMIQFIESNTQPRDLDSGNS